MKKYNVFVHIVSNCVIIALLFGLYIACVPSSQTQAVSAPIYKGDSSSNRVALMINVYEGSEYVERILEILDKRNAVCTFFIGGVWADKNHDLVKKMSQFNELGNHGYLHLDHANISEKQNREEIVLCERLVEKITGYKTVLFAPPSGSFNATTTKVCTELNYKMIMWTKDTIDWRDHDYELIYKRATTDISGGDMILMHPTEHTVRALPKILDYYAEKGLETATVSEIVRGVDGF